MPIRLRAFRWRRGCLGRGPIAFSALGLIWLTPSFPAAPSVPASRCSDCARPLAITNVHVLSMLSPHVQAAQTVVVRERRVTDIGPVESTRIPTDALVIDGRDGYLMPGLIDAHVHVREKELAAYVAHGVLTVRNMWGYPRLRAIKSDLKSGKRLGPTIYSLSPGLDASPGQWPLTQFVDEPAAADSVVAVQDGEGWKVIKVYQGLSLASFDAIAAAVRQRGLRFAGHVPTAVPIEHALASGMTSIEHLSGYDQAVNASHARNSWGWAQADDARFRKLAAKTLESGVVNCPTLAIQASLARDRGPAERDAAVANMRKFVWTLYKAGAPLVAGTDAGIDRVAAGSSMLDELREFEAAGLPRYDALRAATVSAGTLLGQPQLGTIAIGAPAQLLLLRANPLDDLDALLTLEGVVLRGSWQPLQKAGSPPALTAGAPASTSSPGRPRPAGLRAPGVPSPRE